MKKQLKIDGIDDSSGPMFPFNTRSRFDLPPEYAEARTQRPVLPVTLWNGQRAWLLTRYEDYCAVLMDPRFSGRFAHPDFPTVTEARRTVDLAEKAFVGMDSPDHGRFRKMVAGEFTAKRMAALGPSIEAIMDGLLDAMERKGTPTDLVADLAVGMPALLMCELLGTPYADHEYIGKCAAGRHGLTQTSEEAMKAAENLAEYCRQLIARKEREPSEDMTTRALQEYVLTGEMTREEYANILAMILRAGHDTTTNMIGLGTLLLLTHPDQLNKLKADPGLVRQAVEEMLRFLTPVQFSPRRVALEDVEVNGSLIRKGDGVFAISASANRDDAEFSDPDRFDITRQAVSHVAFGYGIHRCLGQMLARVELQIVFPKLFARFPDLRLAESLDNIRFKYDSQIYGLHSLHVAW